MHAIILTLRKHLPAMLMACPVADDTIVRAMKIFMEKFIVKDNSRRERMLLMLEWRFLFLWNEVLKSVKHLCVIWLSSNPNVQLGLWCIRVLVKPYYSNINQVHKSQSRVKEKCVHPSVSIQISVSSNHITRYNESATAVVVEYWISQHR